MHKIILVTIFLILYTTISLGQVNTEYLRPTFKINHVKQSLSLSTNVVKGNSDYISYNIKYDIDYSNKYFETFTIFSLSEKESDDDLIDKYNFIHTRLQIRQNKKTNFEYYFQTEYEPFNNLKKRTLHGVGIRKKTVHSDLHIITLGTSIMYENILYTTLEKESNLRISNYLTLSKTFKNNLTFKTANYVQPKLNNINNIKLLSTTSLSIKLKENINLESTLEYSFNSNPYDELKKYDLDLEQGIKLLF